MRSKGGRRGCLGPHGRTEALASSRAQVGEAVIASRPGRATQLPAPPQSLAPVALLGAPFLDPPGPLHMDRQGLAIS